MTKKQRHALIKRRVSLHFTYQWESYLDNDQYLKIDIYTYEQRAKREQRRLREQCEQ